MSTIEQTPSKGGWHSRPADHAGAESGIDGRVAIAHADRMIAIPDAQ